MHVSISVLVLFPLENFFHVKDWESALLPQRNLKMGGWNFFGGGWGSARGDLWVYAKETARDRDKNLPDILCQLARLLLKEMACVRDHCKESVGDVWL